MATQSESIVRDSWVQWALKAYQKQQEDYEKYEAYYDGDHKLEFATDRWQATFGTVFEQFSDNWCQVVVDALSQRLRITGWSDDKHHAETSKQIIQVQSNGQGSRMPDPKDPTHMAEGIWDESHVDQEEVDLVIQTLIKGDGYLIVWPSPDEGDDRIDMFYNDATEVAVSYDRKDRRVIDRAAKRWIDDDNKVRLELYLPDQIYRFSMDSFSSEPLETMWMDTTVWSELLNGESLPGGWTLVDQIENPYGIVPVFHFRNKSRGSTHGISELKTVIPVQNAVNKVLMDMMVASEFGSFRQKWMAGGGHPKDGWKAGPERVWATTDPNARFGAFPETDIEPYTRVVETLVGHISKITQTPMHYLRVSGDMPSGEALKTAEAALIFKAKDRQRSFGHSWSHAMTFAVALKSGAETADEIEEFMHDPVYPIFADPEQTHDLEQAQTAQLKSILGVPLTQLWAEHFNYSQDQIDSFIKENRAIAASVMAQLIAQAGQLPPGLLEQAGVADVEGIREVLASAAKGDLPGMIQALQGLDVSQIAGLLPKSSSAKTTAGEATTKPQANTSPPASPTRRSSGFRD